MTTRSRVAGARRVVRGAGKAGRTAGRVVGRASGGRKSTTKHAEEQNAVLLGPWFVLLAGAIIGQLVHTSFQSMGASVWLAYIALTSATGLVSYASWHTTKSRSSLALGHTLTTVIGAGVWLMFAATTGLFRMEDVSWWLWSVPVPVHPTFELWYMFGGAAAIAWNIRQGVNRDASKTAEDEPDAWEDAGVGGVTGTVKRVNEYKMQGILTLAPAMTVESLQHALPALESSHGWPRKSARVLPAPGVPIFGKRHKALVVVMIKDPLAQTVPWPGVHLKRGMNLMSLIPTGLDQDGDESGLWVCRPEGTKHGLVQGMTGSGKSEGEKPVVLYTAALGAVNIILDTVKKTQTFGPLAPALHWLAVDEGTAKAILRRLAKEVIPARTEYLAYEGLSQWSLKSKLSLLRIHIEEAWDLVDTDEITAIALSARSAGIQLTLSLQRASHEMISTTVREQLGTRRCYGLAGHFGTMILDDDVMEAGADPEKWKDTIPGMHYMQRGAMTLDEKVQERRSYFDSGSITFADAAKQIASKLKPMDEITAAAFGPLWSNRILPLQVVSRVGSIRANVTRETADVLKSAADTVGVLKSDEIGELEEPVLKETPLSQQTIDALNASIDEDLVDASALRGPAGHPSACVSQQRSEGDVAGIEGMTPELVEFMAHLSGATADEMKRAMEIYVERGGDVDGIINGIDVGGPEGEDMHVIHSEDYIVSTRSDDGSKVTISTPGLADRVIDFGDDAPDAEELVVLAGVDPDVPLEERPAGRAPLRLGAPEDVQGGKWPQDRFDAALMARFEQLKKEGRSIVKAADFMDIIVDSAWTRTIIYPRLRSWEDLGLVTATDDGFVVVKG